ncbi:Pantoate--beta-alanine ligase-like protein, partial [Drosera capensis]
MPPPHPLIITSKSEMRNWSRTRRSATKSTICLVPTMGSLHAGQLGLIAEARTRADVVVASIYVNPGQFARGEDLGSCPMDFEGDFGKIKGLDTARTGDELETEGGHGTWVRVEKLEKGLCGKSRPLFFRGVATIVTKLFNIVEPDVAIFGKKDYQQWRIIHRMVAFKGQSDALKGQVDCKELRKFVANSIQGADGRVDYAE